MGTNCPCMCPQDQTREEMGFGIGGGNGRKPLEYCDWKSPSDANRHRRGKIKSTAPWWQGQTWSSEGKESRREARVRGAAIEPSVSNY